MNDQSRVIRCNRTYVVGFRDWQVDSRDGSKKVEDDFDYQFTPSTGARSASNDYSMELDLYVPLLYLILVATHAI